MKMQTILIVDDSQLVREMLDQILCEKYHIIKACCGADAIELLKAVGDEIKIVLLDLIMRNGDGFSVLEFMQHSGLQQHIPVVVITAETDVDSLGRAFELGAAEVLQKPFDGRIIDKRIKNLLELYYDKNLLENIVKDQIETLRLQTEKLMKTNEIIIDALSAIIEYRSMESGQHTKRIRGLTKILLMDLVIHQEKYEDLFSSVDTIAEAATMHDIGKIAIPDKVLLKPAALDADEFEIMKTHTTLGFEMLYHFARIDDKEYLRYCQEICLSHHERHDGKGYPDGLAGEDIPISAQVVSIVDAYDALTHERVYKEAYPFEVAERMILERECGVFAPEIIESFRRTLPELRQFMKDHPDGLT